MAILKEIIGLKTEADYETLKNGGTVNYGGEDIVLDDNTIYTTESKEGDESSTNYNKQEIDDLLNTIRESINSLIEQLNNKTAKTGDVVSGTFEFANSGNIISVNFGNIRIASENGGDYLIGDTALDGNLRVSSHNNDSPRTLTFDLFDKILLNANTVTVPDVTIS
jgi:hypothetical protein